MDAESRPSTWGLNNGPFEKGLLDPNHFETGHFETGHFETGHFETGHFETGHFETKQAARAAVLKKLRPRRSKAVQAGAFAPLPEQAASGVPRA